MTKPTIFTIGHSNHPIERFLGLLKDAEINMVVDVRSSPFSRMFPHFNQDSLKKSLGETSIGYLFLGESIGGRSNDPEDYVEGQVVYRLLAQKDSFKSGMTRLRDGATKYRIAIMCSEKEPLDCHRTLLVSEGLTEMGIEVGHIHPDGSVESHQDALARLLRLHNLSSPDLFSDDSARLSEALTLQEKKIAFQFSKANGTREEFE